MRRHLLSISIVIAAATPTVEAATFERSRIAPELGIDALTRSVARERLGRDLFADPWATVTLGTLDVYEGFPYLERRAFQVVSDPRWNRLVYGESGRTLAAWDGAGTALGRLSKPHGLAVDERQRVYVADAGNGRVVVLEAILDGGEITLRPGWAIGGLADPHDVAYSDGGTPFVAGDDVLFVAETGRNRVVAYALSEGSARAIATVGALGSGEGRFAGPIAIAAGRTERGNTPDVYVADAHSRRIVRLRLEGGALRWIGEHRHDAHLVTALDTDHWGNVYAAAPRQGVVHKLSPALAPVAELRSELVNPRAFHVPFLTVRDHRDGRIERMGQPGAISLDRWSDAGGLRLWSLGVEVRDLTVPDDAAPIARFVLTDRARVRVDVVDAATGKPTAGRELGTLDAGAHAIPLGTGELATAGASLVRVTATPGYAAAAPAMAQALVGGPGGVWALSGGVALLGAFPNPVAASTRIGFVIPGGARASLRIFDAAGRRVRAYGDGFAAGYHEVVWDAADERGVRVPAGVYYCRLQSGAEERVRPLVVVR